MLYCRQCGVCGYFRRSAPFYVYCWQRKLLHEEIKSWEQHGTIRLTSLREVRSWQATMFFCATIPPSRRMRKRLSGFLHWLFEIGVIIKGIDGFFEVIGGSLLLFISTQHLGDIVKFITEHELSQDPNDAVAGAVLAFVSHLSISSKLFGALYLLSHGTLKLFLVYHLLKERLWVFPVAIGVMQVFVLYQLYRVSVHHSFGLQILTLLDLLVIGFIWREWRVRRRVIERPMVAC